MNVREENRIGAHFIPSIVEAKFHIGFRVFRAWATAVVEEERALDSSL